MKQCEDCKSDSPRRMRCPHCKLLVCLWCYHHVHGCGPSHPSAECWDRKKPAAKVAGTPDTGKGW